MIKVNSKGSFKSTETFLTNYSHKNYDALLKRYGRRGVDLLKAATPVDTGVTADSWFYKIVKTEEGSKIEWHNSNTVNDVPIVILLVYGHGLQNGSYVEGVNFVNPALEPMFKSLAKELLKEVD